MYWLSDLQATYKRPTAYINHPLSGVVYSYVIMNVMCMSQSKSRGSKPVFNQSNATNYGVDRGTGLRRNGGFQYIKRRPKPVTHLHQSGVIWNQV